MTTSQKLGLVLFLAVNAWSLFLFMITRRPAEERTLNDLLARDREFKDVGNDVRSFKPSPQNPVNRTVPADRTALLKPHPSNL